jgi:hypothetical protein
MQIFKFIHLDFSLDSYPFTFYPYVLPTNHILLLLIIWLSLTFSFPPPPLGIPHFCFFLFHPSTVIEILKIVLFPLHDLVLWTHSTNDAFSTKSTHHLITSSIPVTPSPLSKSHWKALWKLNLNHRLKLFLWKMVWNIIPTKFRISQTIDSSPQDTSCSLCSFPIDSIHHRFFLLPYSSCGLTPTFLALG